MPPAVSPRCRPSSVVSQRLEASIMTPSAIFRVFIQRPGRGEQGGGLRNRATNSHGAAIPARAPENQPQLLKRSGKRESDGRAQEGSRAGRCQQGGKNALAEAARHPGAAGGRHPAHGCRGKQHPTTPKRFSEKRKVTATIKPINQGF